MNKREMLHRISKGEDSLELGVEKWGDIANGDGFDVGDANCALCEEYKHTDNHGVCWSCPVYKLTGRDKCKETPYITWLEHQKKHHNAIKHPYYARCFKCKYIALDMQKFLKSLKRGKLVIHSIREKHNVGKTFKLSQYRALAVLTNGVSVLDTTKKLNIPFSDVGAERLLVKLSELYREEGERIPKILSAGEFVKGKSDDFSNVKNRSGGYGLGSGT